MTKDQLIRVFNQVCLDIESGGYDNDLGEFVEFPKVNKLKKGQEMYEEIDSLEDDYELPNYPKTEIYCQNVDSFVKAIEMGDKCAVLNMASAISAGGGVKNGSMAQEEELCRRSNLIYSLYSFTPIGKELFNFDRTYKAKYPIPFFGGIYTPYVSIYREPQTYKPMDQPKLCSVISCSSIIRPELDPDTGLMLKRYERLIRRKIRQILRISILNGHSKLVLGAFGCGAYKNPPKHVARLFDEILKEKEFKHSFEEICFAILEDNNSRRSHNPEGNLKPFVDIFGLKKK